MDAPDTAVGARKRKPRKGKTCAHLSTLSVSRPSGSSLVGGASARAGDQDRAGDGRGRQRGGAAKTIAARGATDAVTNDEIIQLANDAKRIVRAVVALTGRGDDDPEVRGLGNRLHQIAGPLPDCERLLGKCRTML